MEHSYIIECPHFYLKPMNEDSAERYRQLRNMEENRKWFFHNEVISADEQRRWYTRYLAEDGDYMFGAFERESQKYIGGIGIYDLDRTELTAEVGRILIDRTYAGKGYGAEAIGGIVRFAHDRLELRLLNAYICSDNAASIRSFEKSGFKRHRAQENDGIVKMALCLGTIISGNTGGVCE
ncbi:MAG: GNAT family N-acetyltransferase [Lachnospiraceae bacterium]|nr:GNAT family N-acetyltransferase [Lachnospiraceae bacterium]